MSVIEFYEEKIDSFKTLRDIYDKALALQKARGEQYDKTGNDEERSMPKVVRAFNAITNLELTEAQGWLFMQVLKQVRLFSNTDKTHVDSVEDLVSYSGLLAECMLNADKKQ